ncbi:MAG TPA: hypothetical protein VEC19_03190 [Usitatibacter sp.]|nr:hypothetical protein [Usitatibacter sp.]
MKPTVFLISSALAIGLSLAAVGIRAAVDTPPSLMSPVDYEQLKRALDADTRLGIARCREAPDAAREICRAEVRAQERVRKAELAARYYGTVSAQAELVTARAKAAYDIARARCSVRAGEQRADCLRAARAEKNKELAELKVRQS